MGLLVPDITKPVTLQLTKDDAKREAMGRFLSLAGASVGVLGGIMVLRANPAAAALLNGGGPVKMTLSVDQAKQDALGKSLALIGTAVGMGGSVLVMSANPKMKPQFTSLYNQLPSSMRENKSLLALLFFGAIGGAAYYMLKSQNTAMSTK